MSEAIYLTSLPIAIAVGIYCGRLAWKEELPRWALTFVVGVAMGTSVMLIITAIAKAIK